MKNVEKLRDEAVDLILQYGMIDGSHHKQWVLDQVLRILLDTEYDGVIETFNSFTDENNELYDEWDVGIAP